MQWLITQPSIKQQSNYGKTIVLFQRFPTLSIKKLNGIIKLFFKDVKMKGVKEKNIIYTGYMRTRFRSKVPFLT